MRGRERRAFEGLVADHGVEPPGVGAGGLADVAIVLEDGVAAHREFVAPQHAVDIQARTIAVEAVPAHARLRTIAGEVRRGGRHVHRAGGGAEAEHRRVRPAADFHGVEYRRVDRHPATRLEVGEGEVRRADPAHAVRSLRVERVVSRASVAVDIELRVGAGALRARLVKEDVVDIEHRKVGHLLLRDDRDGRSEILDL